MRKRFFLNNGFTLIELLVAVTIIGLLAMVGTFNAVKAIERNRDNRRKADLSQLADALEKFYYANRIYPNSEHVDGLPDVSERWLLDFSMAKYAELTDRCDRCLEYFPYIPNLAPQYIARLPHDPKPVVRYPGKIGYMYRSDSQNYKVVSYKGLESAGEVPKNDPYFDPNSTTMTIAKKCFQVSSPKAYNWYWIN